MESSKIEECFEKQLLCDLYQRVSPDYLPLINGRRPNMRTSKEDDAESGGVLNFNGFDRKPPRFRSGSTPSTDHDPSSSPNTATSDSLQLDNHASKTQNNKQENGLGGDVLLQWGHNKRSRRSRAENRGVTNDQERQVIKIHRRGASGGAKQMANRLDTAMPPPSTIAAYCRGANLRPSALLNRNLDERSISINGSSTSNGNSQILSRSFGKGSPSPDKTDKTSSCSAGATGEKLNGSTVQAVPMNAESEPQPEPETAAAADKLNLDRFEWPRIYISLSRKEKEDDFLIMKGTKLPQRPKKRAKNVDRTLQYCFPGMWLSDLTRGRYEVREKKCVKKRRRGLKGMESMDSDSE